jgi:hypothetical protein
MCNDQPTGLTTEKWWFESRQDLSVSQSVRTVPGYGECKWPWGEADQSLSLMIRALSHLHCPPHVVATQGRLIDSQCIRHRYTFFVLRFAVTVNWTETETNSVITHYVWLAEACVLGWHVPPSQHWQKAICLFHFQIHCDTHTHARTHTHTVHKPDKSRLNSGNACYRSVQNFFLFFSSLLLFNKNVQWHRVCLIQTQNCQRRCSPTLFFRFSAFRPCDDGWRLRPRN